MVADGLIADDFAFVATTDGVVRIRPDGTREVLLARGEGVDIPTSAAFDAVGGDRTWLWERGQGVFARRAISPRRSWRQPYSRNNTC